MTTKQAATTAVGRDADSTTLTTKMKGGTRSNRTFSVTTSATCHANQAGTLGIASSGNGTLYIQKQNSKGTTTVTWTFKKQTPLSFERTSPPPQLALDVINSSKSPACAHPFSMKATVVSGDNLYSNHLRNLVIPANKEGKTVIFNFQHSKTPPLTTKNSPGIRRVAVSIEVNTGCDTTLSVKNIRFIDSSATSSKRKQSDVAPLGKGRPDTPLEIPSPPASPTITPEASPGPNPCQTEAARMALAGCEEDEKKFASTCSLRGCACVPDFQNNTFILQITSTFSPSDIDSPCRNTVCGNSVGVCSTAGVCIPAQLKDANSSLFDISRGDIWHRRDVSSDCIDFKKRLPTREELCLMTPEHLEQSVRSTLAVSKPCIDEEGKDGICNKDGRCGPPLPFQPSCTEQDNCALCSPARANLKRICWNKKCITEEDAARALCLAEESQGSDSFCKPCVATIARNSAGLCGTTTIRTSQPERRRGIKVYMDGARCFQRGIEGDCRFGSCQSPVQPTPTTTAAPRSTPT